MNLPILRRKKDKAYVAIAVAEILVLTLVASGILKSGSHKFCKQSSLFAGGACAARVSF